MKVSCSACGADYTLDDAKVPKTGNPFITCTSCQAKVRLNVASAAGNDDGDVIDGSTPPTTLDDHDLIPLNPIGHTTEPVNLGTGAANLPAAVIPLTSSRPGPTDARGGTPLPPPPQDVLPLVSGAPLIPAAPHVRGLAAMDLTPVAPTEGLTALAAQTPIMPPPPETAIPLASDIPIMPPPPETAIPLASDIPIMPPPPEAAIPLASDMPIMPPPPETAIPLASDIPIMPPPPPETAIPLTGEMPAMPPHAEDAIPLASDGPDPIMPPAPAEAIPLVGEAPLVPAPDIALNAAVKPTGGLDSLFDLPEATLDHSAGLQSDPQANAGVVEDLPMAVEPADLPGPLGASKPHAPPTPGGIDGIPLDDLPAALSSEAPSLMDDLDSGTPVSLAELPTMDLQMPAAADPFSNTGDFADQAGQPLAIEDAPQVKLAPAAMAKDKKPSRRLWLGLLVIPLAGAAFIGFGERFTGMALLSGQTPAPVPPTTNSTADAQETEPTKIDEDQNSNKEEAPAPTPRPAEITSDNVDGLPYADLVVLSGKDASADESAGLWALYRMAADFSDSDAQEALIDKAPRRPESSELNAMGKAATVGALLLSGKKSVARRLADTLARQDKTSAHLSYMAGLTALPNAKRAARSLEAAIDTAGDWVGPRVALGELRLASQRASERAAGLDEIRNLLKLRGDDLRTIDHLTMASALWDNQHYALLGSLSSKLMQHSGTLPPPKAALLRRFVRAGLLMRGNYEELNTRLSADQSGSADTLADRLRLHHTLAAEQQGDARQQLEKQSEALFKTAWDNQELKDETRVRLAVIRGEWLVANGKADAAREIVELLKSAPARFSGGWRTYLDGRILQHENKTRLAQAAFAAAYRKAPRPVEARIQQVLSDTNDAKRNKRLEQILRRDGGAPAALAMARDLTASGRPGEALLFFEAAFWQDPLVDDPTTVRLDWAEAMRSAGQVEQAFERAGAIATARGADPRPVHYLIGMSRRQGDAERLEHWYQLLMGHEPNQPEHKINLASELLALDKHASARAILGPMLDDEKLPKSHELRFQWARAWSLEDPIKARAFLIDLRAEKATARLHMLLGEIDHRRGKTDTALESFKDAVKLDDSLTEARFYAAQIYATDGANLRAETELKLVLSKIQNHFAAQTLLGDVLCALDRWRECARSYQKATTAPVTESPTVETLLKLAKVQIHHLNQLRPGIRTLQQVVEIDPKNAEAFHLLGYTLNDVGRRGEARKSLETYLDLEPSNALADEVRTLLKTL